jgi:hypothetical protein
VIAMNSIHRLGVTIAGFATVLMVAGVFVVEGYMDAKETVATSTAQASQMADPTTDATVSLTPKTIYVNPLPTPQVIQAAQPPAPAQQPQPPVIHVVVPGFGGDDGGGSDD